MRPCSTCGAHVRISDASCPHCGATGARSSVLPAAAILMGLALAGCPDPVNKDVQALYGVAVEDADEDGFDNIEDCDDGDPEINPDAEETPDDGVDSNCDGEDNT